MKHIQLKSTLLVHVICHITIKCIYSDNIVKYSISLQNVLEWNVVLDILGTFHHGKKTKDSDLGLLTRQDFIGETSVQKHQNDTADEFWNIVDGGEVTQ